MLTSVERVLIMKGADLLREVGPRHLVELAEVAREVEFTVGDTIYLEDDLADAIYMVVEGRVRLSTKERPTSEVGPGEAFGTWALVDDSSRDQRAECIEDGLALALHRDAFYDVAAGDLTLLQEVVRALAKRLRALVSERPEEARVEGEGIEKPAAMVKAEAGEPAPAPDVAATPTPGSALTAAALGQASAEVPPVSPASSPAIPTAEAEKATQVPKSPVVKP
jgi:signal-transduction protein with cAMP-binding, CBS, and nucleotidyltransferase domain